MSDMEEIIRRAISKGTARIGCGFLLIAIAVLLLVSMSGCKPTRLVTETITKTDTVTIRHDSIIVHDRIVPVEVQLPPSIQYVEIPITHDTTSVLSDKFYTSIASVFNGTLQHSLKTNPDAKVSGSSIVHDTVKVYVDSTMINNNSSHMEIKEVNKLTGFQKIMQALGWAFIVVLIGSIVYFVRKFLPIR